MHARRGDPQEQREQDLTDQVVASFDGADERLRTLLVALTRHLHAVVRETRPSQEEWARAIEFLTATGQACTPERQEMVLLSDVLGVSMQTVTVNQGGAGAGEAPAATEATVLGPFFLADSPEVGQGGDIAGGAPGEPCLVSGRVTDTDGAPVAGALVEAWEADDEGLYDVQRDEERGRRRMSGRGWLRTDEDGRYRFWGLTPTPYPIPDDGPVGRLLRATGRSPMRAAHLHLRVTAEGMDPLTTHVFVQGDPLLAGDSVFGVRESLVRPFVPHQAGEEPPDGHDVGGRAWSSVEFDVVLAPLAGGGAG